MSGFLNSKWKVFLWINVLWLLGTASVGYTTYTGEVLNGTNNVVETIKIVFLALGGLGIVLPTYINATNAIEARHGEKLENTFKLIEKWDDPHLFSARRLTRELKSEKAGLSDNSLIEKIENDEELKQSIILVANYFEHIRISIKTRRIDVDLFKEALGSVVLDINKRLHPYIEKQGEQYIKDWDSLATMLK